MKLEKKAILFYIATIAYAAYIFYLSSRESLKGSGVEVTGFDKANHFMEYSILGFLLFFSVYLTPFAGAFIRRWLDEEWGEYALIAWVLGSLYGVSDEIHQHFVPGRTFDVFDMTADSLGTLAGIAGALIILFIYTHHLAPSFTRVPTDRKGEKLTLALSEKADEGEIGVKTAPGLADEGEMEVKD